MSFLELKRYLQYSHGTVLGLPQIFYSTYYKESGAWKTNLYLNSGQV